MAIETANVVDLLFVFEWINDGKKAWVPEVQERGKNPEFKSRQDLPHAVHNGWTIQAYLILSCSALLHFTDVKQKCQEKQQVTQKT